MIRTYRALIVLLLGVLALVAPASTASGQDLAKRLILKDGSYQLATKWEIKGDRVRYYSAEREEWEEIPYAFIDWPATDKYQKDRTAGIPSPEAVELDKEEAAERQTEGARSPQVAPGLRLPADSSVMLLDTFQNQPQLLELDQQGGEVNRNTKENMLRSAIDPIASARQTIEIDGAHARVQSHVAVPAIYVNLRQNQEAGPEGQPQQAQQAELPWERFHIVRTQAKRGKRVVGNVKINPIGKVHQEQSLVPTTAERLTGDWVKVTPSAPLEPGEYAVVELLGERGMNLYVWDFGVNPSAPANSGGLNPEPASSQRTDQPKDLQKPRK